MQSWIAPVFTLLLSLTSWTDANAEFPSKPVTILVPFGAGSGTDVVTRVIAEPLGSALKQSIVVEDKPGANGAIAAMQVARSVPDGHTLLMGTNSPLSAAPMLNKTLGYDPINDFVPVCRVGSYTFIVAVHRDMFKGWYRQGGATPSLSYNHGKNTYPVLMLRVRIEPLLSKVQKVLTGSGYLHNPSIKPRPLWVVDSRE